MEILSTPPAGPNNNLWVTEATGMCTYDCDMPNGSNIDLFWAIGDVVGPHGAKMKNYRFCSYGNFGDKITVFTCLLSNGVAIAFPGT